MMGYRKYADAFSEVLGVLRQLPKYDYEKIPKKLIETFEANCNREYIFLYDPTQSLLEQKISNEAQMIIVIIYRDYLANPEQREKLEAKNKLRQFNFDDFFEEKDIETLLEENIVTDKKSKRRKTKNKKNKRLKEKKVKPDNKAKKNRYKKESKKYKIVNIILNILLIGFIILLIISLREIILWHYDNKVNEEISKELSKAITVVEPENTSDIEFGETEGPKYQVDFESLNAINPDVIAWVKVNGTDVEHTIVKTINNEYYLKHNFKKEYNVAGWIFADYKNKFDGTDKNIVIYGHNRRDGSMFSSLKNILTPEWYNNEENRKITFITENEECTYEVFSVYQIEKEEYYLQTDFQDINKFGNFVNTLKKRSIKDFNVEVTAEDSILTLSTCANNNDYRIVLHAKKITN